MSWSRRSDSAAPVVVAALCAGAIVAGVVLALFGTGSDPDTWPTPGGPPAGPPLDTPLPSAYAMPGPGSPAPAPAAPDAKASTEDSPAGPGGPAADQPGTRSRSR